MNKNPNHPMVMRMLNGFTGRLIVWRSKDGTRCVVAEKSPDTGSVTLLGKVETSRDRHYYPGHVTVVKKGQLTKGGKRELREMIKAVYNDDGKSWLK